MSINFNQNVKTQMVFCQKLLIFLDQKLLVNCQTVNILEMAKRNFGNIQDRNGIKGCNNSQSKGRNQ